jgi:hypothetical protein
MEAGQTVRVRQTRSVAERWRGRVGVVVACERPESAWPAVVVRIDGTEVPLFADEVEPVAAAAGPACPG